MKKSITIRQQHDKTVNACRQCTVLGISLQICVHHCNPWREDCYLMDRCFLGVISLMVYLSRPKPFPFCVKKHLSEVRVGGFHQVLCVYACDISVMLEGWAWQREEILIIAQKTYYVCISHVTITSETHCLHVSAVRRRKEVDVIGEILGTSRFLVCVSIC